MKMRITVNIEDEDNTEVTEPTTIEVDVPDFEAFRYMARIPSWDSHMGRSSRRSCFYVISLLFSMRRASFDEPIWGHNIFSYAFSR